MYDTRYQDALLPCLQVNRCDAVVVEKSVFDRWNWFRGGLPAWRSSGLKYDAAAAQ